MTEPNQPYSRNLSTTPFYDTNTQSQTFGLEPNYPCCTVNHPQGYPKFVMYSFLKKGENGLVHALLSPGNVKTSIQGEVVEVDCRTDYPFNSELSYNIINQAPSLELFLRVPQWSTGHKVYGASASAVDPSTGLIAIKIPTGTTKLRYTIDMKLTTSPRTNDTVAVYYGAVLYGLYIEPEISSEPPKFYTNQSQYPAGTYPPQAKDHTLLNTTEWNVAIDESTLIYHSGSGPLPLDRVFEDGKSLPMSVTAKGCLIDWPLFLGAVPDAPIPKANRTCLGDVFEVTLKPYGSAKLHMSDLPTIDLSEK